MDRARYVSERLYAELKRKRASIVLRTPTSLPGSIPQPNPPRYTALRLDGNHAAGVSSITVRADALSGRFVAGDVLQAGNEEMIVAADAIASSNAAVLTLTRPTVGTWASGTALAPSWKADRRIFAMTRSTGVRQIEGVLVEQRGYAVTISAHRLGAVPTLQDLIIFPGAEPRRVVAIDPILVDGATVGYILNAR